MVINTINEYESLNRRYLFRGQSNKNWHPLPSTYRNNSSIKNPALEKHSVDQFVQHLKERGYRDFPPELNQFDFITKPAVIFPTEELLPYWALAQHYAFDSEFHWLKTSLLDVTHNLDIAAYFSVENEENEALDGKIFVFDISKIKEPYKFYEPRGGSRMEARLVVQDCAFIYREQICEHMDEHIPYKNKEPFCEIVEDTIAVPCTLKPILKEYLQKKLCDLLIKPRLILGRITPNLATAGCHSYEELKEMNSPAVNRAEIPGDKHSIY